jgi:hypothetical protein
MKQQRNGTSKQKDTSFLILAEKLYRPSYARYIEEKERTEHIWRPGRIKYSLHRPEEVEEIEQS